MSEMELRPVGRFAKHRLDEFSHSLAKRWASCGGTYATMFTENVMTECLFCQSAEPFSTVEHIIPESLGNDELFLRDEVCDTCQAYFGKEVEKFVLEKTPVAFWRTLLGIRTKRGRLPSVDLSQPKQQKGMLPTRHDAHDDHIGFTAHVDGSTSIDIHDPKLVRELLDNSRSEFQFVFTPKVLSLFARFLVKVGLELLCSTNRAAAYSPDFDDARSFARRAAGGSLWPIFYYTEGSITDLRTIEPDSEDIIERIVCYSYRLFDFRSYCVFELGIGTDRWVLTLNGRYPTPDLVGAFPGRQLDLIWYANVK